MKSKSGMNERYTKQCLEANRHNEATAYYFLMLKQILLEGESLEYYEDGS